MTAEKCILHWNEAPSTKALVPCTKFAFAKIKDYCRLWEWTQSAQDLKIVHRFLAAMPEVFTEEVPLLFFHRGCYHRFTHKIRLRKAKIEAKRTIKPKLEQEVEPEARFPNKCIFCCKERNRHCRKKMPLGYITESLTRCRRPNVVGKIQAKAAELNDQELLAQIRGRDMIAEWAMYHEMCYSDYVNKFHASTVPIEDCPAMDTEAFRRFMKEEIIPQVQNGKSCVPLNAFTDLFNDTIKSAKHLKSELPLFELRKHCPFLRLTKAEALILPPVSQSLTGALQKPREPASKSTKDRGQKRKRAGDRMDSKYTDMLHYAQSLHSKISLVFAGNQEAPPPLELLNFLAACVDGSQLTPDTFARLPNATRGKVTRIARNIVRLSAGAMENNGTHLETAQNGGIQALAEQWLAMYGLI